MNDFKEGGGRENNYVTIVIPGKSVWRVLFILNPNLSPINPTTLEATKKREKDSGSWEVSFMA